MTAGKFVGEAITTAVLRLNPFGREGYERRAANKAYRKARRKARRGEALTEDEFEIFTTHKETSMAMNTGLRSSSNAGIMGVVSVIVLQLLPLIPGLQDLAQTPEFASAVTGLLMWVGGRFTRTPEAPKVI